MRPTTIVGLTSFLGLAFAGTVLTGCDLEVEVKNAAPRVTWVAVEPASGGIAEVTVWLSDREGDPVDLTASFELDGTDAGELALATGGHGLVGLTTHEARLDPNGQPHLVRWLVDGVSTSAAVRLVFAPADDEAGAGEVVATPTFTLSDGMSDPVEVESLDE